MGLAVGDAVGTTLEFKRPGTFEPITDMIGGGPFELEVGKWTDDTSMALCLAQSLIDQKRCDPYDQMIKYLNWFRDGYMSSEDECVDIGNTTYDAIVNFENSGEAISGNTDRMSAGNGSIMRLAPIPMMYRKDLDLAIEKARISAKTTHGAPQSVDTAGFFSYLIVKALNQATKSELMNNHSLELEGLDHELVPILEGSYLYKNPPQIVGSGYVIKSIEAALWAFENSTSFKEGCLKAANLGNDADTTAAVYGQIAGAHYGLSGIPQEWIDKLYMKDEIEQMAEKIFALTNEIEELN